MGCLGVHFAITTEQMGRLLEVAYGGSDDPDEAVQGEIDKIENKWVRKYLFETDKAWDPIHRTLNLDNTPGGRLSCEGGDHPLDLCIVGGEQLHEGEDYSICLIRPEEVAELAAALAEIDETWMRKRFFTLDPRAAQYDIDEDQFEYLWGNFEGLPEFFARAAADGRAVIFTVSL